MPILVAIIGVLVAGLVAMSVQVHGQSQAADVGDVKISHSPAEAEIKSGTTHTCVISSRTNFNGPTDKVSEFVSEASKSARDMGLRTNTGGVNPAPGLASTDLIVFQEHNLEGTDADPADCTTALLIEEHRGRETLQLPSWARGLIATAAAVAVYLAITLGVAAVFAIVAPEFEVTAVVVGGCIGGFASTFVANYINQVPRDANLTSSAVQCIAGALLPVALGPAKTAMVDRIKNYLGPEAITEVESAISRSSGHSGEITESFRSAAMELSDLVTSEVPVTP